MPAVTAKSSANLARVSCATCRSQKRKCSKEVPACELCRRNQRRCEYPVESPMTGSSEAEMGNGLSTRPRPTFPALAFFDYYSFKRRGEKVEVPRIDLPWEFQNVIGHSDEIRRDIDQYSNSFHLFFPIVSKLRLHHSVTSAIEQLTADTVLLLLSIRLVANTDPTLSPDRVLYDQVKRYSASIERSGVVTVRLLQSNVLIAFYELSHAIFPSAYFTIRHSASIGLALGIQSRSPSFQVLAPANSWCELEERRRTWWGVIMLDRYMSIGTGSDVFSCPDAKPEDLLPMDEASWDQGEPALIQSLAVSSSTNIPVSPFTRASQATHLLSRILRHINEQHVDYRTYYEEAQQLHHIISAFGSALSQEFAVCQDAIAQARMLTPVGICLSAKLALYDHYTCAEVDINGGAGTDVQLAMQQIALREIKSTALAVHSFASVLNEIVAAGFEISHISPLVCNCLYAAGIYYSWYIRETKQVQIENQLGVILEVLRRLGSVWGIAREYVKFLESELL